MSAQAEQRAQPGAGFADAVDRLVNGKPISTKGIIDAIGDLFGAFVRPPPVNYEPTGKPWWEPLREQARAQPPPPPPPPRSGPTDEDIARARRVFGFNGEPVTKDELRARYRKLALKFHPDRKGGSAAKMSQLNAARDLLDATL